VLSRAGLATGDLAGVAASAGPGLIGGLLVGSEFAKGIAIAHGLPYVAVNHLEAHALTARLPGLTEGAGAPFPYLLLLVSGGHCQCVAVEDVGRYRRLGGTVDDAAGEAFDKVAKLLGLSYPGGPVIEARAKNGNPKKFDLPRSMLNSGDLNFSFSGLKTAVRYSLPAILSRGDSAGPARHGSVVDDLCASFQQAVIDVLREKSLRALRQTNSAALTLSGGVSCSRALREDLRAMCEKNGIEFLVAEPWLCTDNAAMIAFAAMLRLQKGITSRLEEEIDPNLALA
jgi:N6-L-threonylcarbamoyladenine synthase